VKRVVRESFRLNAPALAGLDLVVGARNGARSAHNGELRDSLDGLWKKIRERCAVS
jgi:ribonuclease P protein component